MTGSLPNQQLNLEKNLIFMKSQRQLQIGENLKRIMADVFLREDISLKFGAYITILQADVSPDAKQVCIFLDIFGNEPMQEKMVAKLNEMSPHFRYQMAKKLTLRVVPEITFVLDKTQAKAMDLEALMKEEAKKYNELEGGLKKPATRSRKKK